MHAFDVLNDPRIELVGTPVYGLFCTSPGLFCREFWSSGRHRQQGVSATVGGGSKAPGSACRVRMVTARRATPAEPGMALPRPSADSAGSTIVLPSWRPIRTEAGRGLSRMMGGAFRG